RARNYGSVVAEGADLGNLRWLRCACRGQRLRLQHHRCEAKTDSGSRPEIFPTAIQPNLLTRAPTRNEIAAKGISPNNRKTSASGPFKVSPMRINQPERCSCIARSATPCLSSDNQIRSADSTAAAKNPIALSGAILWPSNSSNAAAEPNPAVPK